jgi:hypothetical protein
MTPEAFKALKYGNICQDPRGRKLIVLHTNRDDQDAVPAIGVLECFQISDAESLTLIDATTPQQTVLLNPNLGPTPDVLGILKTVLEKS